MSEEILNTYVEKKESKASYSIEDHANVHDGPMKDVFSALRREVLALDPCVTQEYLMLYIAFKAETNFVDVVPRSKKNLLLTLNMPFSEINDPRGVCRDVTGMGRWGNGDVEASLNSESDIPYIIGLIRQSLERQLGAIES